MSGRIEARRRCKTISFWVTPAQAEQIDKLARMSGYSKQEYLARRALDKQVIVVPSSRVVMLLRDSAEELARAIAKLPDSSFADEGLVREIRWLAGLMAALARYGENEFDAVERIASLERE